MTTRVHLPTDAEIQPATTDLAQPIVQDAWLVDHVHERDVRRDAEARAANERRFLRRLGEAEDVLPPRRRARRRRRDRWIGTSGASGSSRCDAAGRASSGGAREASTS
jgi:hypothetical protein